MESDKDKKAAALIDEYLSVVAEIKKRSKKRMPRGDRRECLKRLLMPLVKRHSLESRPITTNFIDEQIWIDSEININKLTADNEKYSINLMSNNYQGNPRVLIPNDDCICIWSDYKTYRETKARKEIDRTAFVEQLEKEGKQIPTSLRCPPPITSLREGRTSLRDIYEKKLLSLTTETIRSKDLLDQLIVCYMIKKALNGDEKAISKLCSLYEDTAIKIAYKMAEKRSLLGYVDDIKQDAKILLRRIISGNQPEVVVRSLVCGSSVPLWVEKFFFLYYSEYVPREIKKLMKQSPDDPYFYPKEQSNYKELNKIISDNLAEPRRYSGFLSCPPETLRRIALATYLNPFSPIRADTYFKSKSENKRIMKFNNYSFRPNKKTDIYSWLFGNRKKVGGFMSGRFCQLLDEALKKYESKIGLSYHGDRGFQCPICKIGFKKATKADIECPSCGYVLVAVPVKRQNRLFAIKRSKKSAIIDNEETGAALNKLIEKGISKRDAEIFIRNKLKRISQQKLGEKFDLSRGQINRICRKISLQLQPS